MHACYKTILIQFIVPSSPEKPDLNIEFDLKNTKHCYEFVRVILQKVIKFV